LHRCVDQGFAVIKIATPARVLLSLAAMLVVAAALYCAERMSWAAGNDAAQFPNVVLTTQYGTKVRLYDDLLKGKTVAINTFFSGCTDVCPLGTAKMLELQRLLGDRVGRDIQFYSLSIDPTFDTPEVLKAYAERYGASAGWLFLTGKEADIQLASKRLGLGSLQSASPRDNHSNTLMVGREATGQWMKNSVTDNPRFIASSMETFLGWRDTQPSTPAARAGPLQLTNGQFLFQNGCAACHSIGEGKRIGPDLYAVTERRPRAWIERFMLAPDEVLASGDAVALQLLQEHAGVRMPNLGLAHDEVADILRHIELRSEAVRATRVDAHTSMR
jgi:protein SCO1